MRSLMLAALLCVTAHGEPTPRQPESETPVPAELSLADAKRIALAGNPGIAVLLERVRAAQAITRQLGAAMAPQVDLAAGTAWLHDVSAADGDTDDTPLFSGDLSARWLLFDGLATRFRTEAAAEGTAASVAGWHDGRRLLAQSVATTFLNCCLAREAGRVAQRDAEFNHELREEARKRVESGAGDRVAVLNFSVRAREAENRLLSSQGEEQTARQALAALLGLPDATLPAGIELVSRPGLEADDLPPVEDAVAQALANRPDLRQMEHTVARFRSHVRSIRAEGRPQIAAYASAGLARLDDLGFRRDSDVSSSVGIAVTWSIFDGHSRRFRMAEAKARVQAAVAAHDQRVLDLNADVRRALVAADTAAVRLRNQEEIAEMASEIRRIVRKEYLAGLSPLTRLNEAQTDVIRAEGQLNRARFLHQLAREDLAAATGTNVPPPTAATGSPEQEL